jgi:YqaJ-like viral recombinase domain
MQVINIPQGSPEWLAARLGVITASQFANATKMTKTGHSSYGIDYAQALAYERVFSAPSDPVFVNAAMRRGTELEPQARSWYETHTGELVETAGFFVSDCGRFGYSPDGLVGEDGLIEIKCPGGRQFVGCITAEDWSDYLHQVQGGMWISGRQWCDLVLYTDADNGRGYIARILRDEAFIAKLADDLASFDSFVQEIVQKLKNKIGA